MDKASVDLFLLTYAKYFETDKLAFLRDRIATFSDDQMTALTMVMSELKDPTTSLIVSVILGGFGIDRFLINDIGMGLLKILTGGACGILWLIDIFLISARTREKNFEKIMEVLAFNIS